MDETEFNLLDDLNLEPLDSDEFDEEEIKVLERLEKNGFVKRQWIITDEGSEFFETMKEGER